MKEVKLKLNREEMLYLCEYLSIVEAWFDPVKGYAIFGNTVISREYLCLRIATASIIRKMAIDCANRLVRSTGDKFDMKLKEGKAEALFVYCRMQPHNFPIHIYDRITSQLYPAIV